MDMAQRAIEAVRGYIERQLGPISQRLAALEARGPEKGAEGNPGRDGEDGRDGKDGRDGVPGPAGPKGEPGIAGERGEKGDPGRDGKDGRDGVPGPAGPKGEPGIAGERGDKGDPGRDSKDGRDGSPGPAGPKGEPGIAGERGAKGDPGRDGKDGLGFDDLDISYDGERTFTFRMVRGPRTKEWHFKAPLLVDRGVWTEQAYERGDCATHGGSLWIAQRDTRAKPGTGDDWRLACKKGRDGRDAPAREAA
jgi:integrin beta 3